MALKCPLLGMVSEHSIQKLKAGGGARKGMKIQKIGLDPEMQLTGKNDHIFWLHAQSLIPLPSSVTVGRKLWKDDTEQRGGGVPILYFSPNYFILSSAHNAGLKTHLFATYFPIISTFFYIYQLFILFLCTCVHMLNWTRQACRGQRIICVCHLFSSIMYVLKLLNFVLQCCQKPLAAEAFHLGPVTLYLF